MSNFSPDVILCNVEDEEVIFSAASDEFAAESSLEGERHAVIMSKTVETRYKIDKWTGVENFALWSCQMKDKLTAQGQARLLLNE